tara:strand:- start:981 stop:1655 length:675 start_codon:yes stop_codon:yes gene_type:complete
MWLQESIRKSRRMKDEYMVNGVSVFIKDALPEGISGEFIFDYVSSRVPSYLLKNVEVIYVGQFPEMKERDINAFYDNDAIYITNEQEDEMDMIEDIIHEISHAVEHYNRDLIYDDGALQREFIAKRKRLSALLSQKFDVPPDFNINFEYDRAIDDFLYREVGYDVLNQVCVGIFPSGYAATSVSEYWAKGFEELFIGETDFMKKMCPVLYNKLAITIKELKENT